MNQLRARRKASKMLVAVVIMFAACYFPVHALNIVRYTYTDLDQSEVISVLSLLSHWLCYANSAINPLIYNFMSGKMAFYDTFN
jgi:hypocretin (orexin) receptor 2